MPRLLYILSLERSGSTPLCYNLGLRPGLVALGEIDRTLALLTRSRGFDGRACSCGQAIAECPVWKPIVVAVDELKPLSLAERYQRLDAILEPVLGKDTIIVDASKPLDTLQAIAPKFEGRLCVVHLVKDVRAYLESTLNRMATIDRDRLWSEAIQRHPLRARLMLAMPASLVYLWRWSHQNRKMYKALHRNGLPSLRVGYDALCNNTPYWLERMTALSGAGNRPGQHHIVLGSFGYLDGGGNKALRIDQRWRTSPRHRLLNAAHVCVARFNRRLTKTDETHHDSMAIVAQAHDISPQRPEPQRSPDQLHE